MKNPLELLIYGIDHFVQEEKRKEERGGNGREGRREGEEGREEQLELVVFNSVQMGFSGRHKKWER